MARSGNVLREKGEAVIMTKENFRLLHENLAPAFRTGNLAAHGGADLGFLLPLWLKDDSPS